MFHMFIVDNNNVSTLIRNRHFGLTKSFYIIQFVTSKNKVPGGFLIQLN